MEEYIRPKGFFFETFWANSSGGFEGSEILHNKILISISHFLFHFPFHLLSSFSSCLFFVLLLLSSLLSCLLFSCLVLSCLSFSVSLCFCLSVSVLCCVVCRCGRGVVGGRGVCLVCVFVCVFAAR